MNTSSSRLKTALFRPATGPDSVAPPLFPLPQRPHRMIRPAKHLTNLLPLHEPGRALRERTDRNRAPIFTSDANRNLLLQVQDQELDTHREPRAAQHGGENGTIHHTEALAAECELCVVGGQPRYQAAKLSGTGPQPAEYRAATLEVCPMRHRHRSKFEEEALRVDRRRCIGYLSRPGEPRANRVLQLRDGADIVERRVVREFQREPVEAVVVVLLQLAEVLVPCLLTVEAAPAGHADPVEPATWFGWRGLVELVGADGDEAVWFGGGGVERLRFAECERPGEVHAAEGAVLESNVLVGLVGACAD